MPKLEINFAVTLCHTQNRRNTIPPLCVCTVWMTKRWPMLLSNLSKEL